jgi:UDP-N-acetylmuramoyl-tripeptide--D-alanyl-D-alanine ligase
MGKMKITIEDLFNLQGAVIFNPDAYRPLGSVVIDSRKVKKGSLFVAIKGENHDAHNFIQDAVKKGAGAVVIDEKKYRKFHNLEIPVITVGDTTVALGEIAGAWRGKLKAKVVSVSGSNGKTTVKEMIAALLSERFSVVKTEANNNNHIGVPLTILSADEKCEVLVLELGTNHFNEILYTSKIAKPDFALLTNIGDSHLEFLKNRKGVYKEKSALLRAAEENNGTVFLNMDDPIISKEAGSYINGVSFGMTGKVDVKGKICRYDDEGRAEIQITYKNTKFNSSLPLYGESNAGNFVAAAAVALKLGLSPGEITNGARKFAAIHGRLEVKKMKRGIIIDDTYNASPASVESAVRLTQKIKRYKKKLIILGDMFELGKSGARLHRNLSTLFKPDEKLTVITIGPLMKNLHGELRKNKIRSIHFHLREALSLYIQYEDIENSVILVKGSRGMKMEEFVNILEKRFE